MVIRKVASFDRLVKELNDLGRFSYNLPIRGVSRDVINVLDYLFNELKDLELNHQLSGNGHLFEIEFDLDHIIVNTVHKVNLVHVKSFHLSKEDVETFRELLLLIPSKYSSIKVRPKHSYVPEHLRSFNYLVEYNDSQQERTQL